MAEFIIDDGSEEYIFKNKRGEVFASFAFNPTDTHIVERYNDVADFFANYDVAEGESDEDISAEYKRLNTMLREQFNYLLNSDVSSGLFKTYTPTAIMANGEFYAEIVLDKIGEIIEKTAKVRLKKKEARINKHTDKYKK